MVKVCVDNKQGLVQKSGSGFEARDGLDAKKRIIAREGVNTIGRLTQKLEATDVDTQNHTLTVAQLKKGIVVNTTVTGTGAFTTPTATQIIAGDGDGTALKQNGDSIQLYLINDGSTHKTVVTGGTGVTVVGNADVEAECSAIVLFQRTGASAVKAYVIGGLT